MKSRAICNYLKRSAWFVVAGILTSMSGAASATISDEVSQTPLFLNLSNASPNVMFVLDNSGSMQRAYMPDDAGFVGKLKVGLDNCTVNATSTAHGLVGINHGNGAVSSGALCNVAGNAFVFSSRRNTIYYDPSVTYTPPVDENGTSLGDSSFESAWVNGYDLSARDFANRKINLGGHFSLLLGWTGLFIPAGGGSVYIAPSTILTADPDTPAFYYTFIDGCADEFSDACYVRHEPTTVQEKQNFANWYSYYRTRMMSARASIGKVFAEQPEKLRLGYGMIIPGFTTNMANEDIVLADEGSGSFTSNTIVSGVRFFKDSHRSDFYEWLYRGTPHNNGTTPLRRAVADAGRYFEDNTRPWRTNPDTNDGDLLGCRATYTILTTDGYWNSNDESQISGTPMVENNDETVGPTISGPGGQQYQYLPTDPFIGGIPPKIGTLADVAMYFWKRDLRSDITNEVPVTDLNPAFWQHMVLYGVSLGTFGSPGVDAATAFAAIGTQTAVPWGKAFCTDCSGKQDDLLHAAVNSRGGFFSTQTPGQFADALSNILSDVDSRQTASTAVAASSTRVQASTLAYVSSFDTLGWSGDLTAYSLNSDGSFNQLKWKASENLPSPGSRNVLTYDDTSEDGVPFSDGLSNHLKEMLVDPSDSDYATKVTAMIDYLRGDHSPTTLAAGPFRAPKGALGDIINSEPVVSAKNNFHWFDLPESEGGGYDGPGSYGHYLDETKKSRKPVVFVGANDGMLHAFDARESGGEELFAYIPRSVFEKLHLLADPSYQHQFYVDGFMTIGDAFDGAWKTILVGTTGAGGKGVFAIDVSNPDSVDTAAVKWDIGVHSGADFNNDLGYTIGQAQITRLEDGTWVAIFGNGYNSANRHAVLYVVDLFTGALIKKFDTGVGSDGLPNGLSTPFPVLNEGRTHVERVYAGDLQGNMWRFDLSGPVSGWDVAFNGTPLFVARDDNDDPQPITTSPSVAYHPEGGYLVAFGSGKFFSPGDHLVDGNNLETVQSFYVVRDTDQTIAYTGGGANRTSVLQELTLQDKGVATTESGTTSGLRGVTGFPIQWSQYSGWFIDLKVGSDRNGERVLQKPLVAAGKVIFSTYEPTEAECTPGGVTRLMVLEVVDGKPALELPEEFIAVGGAPACGAGDGCASVELIDGPPVGTSVVVVGEIDEYGEVVGDQELVVLGPDGKPLPVGDLLLGRIRWRQWFE